MAKLTELTSTLHTDLRVLPNAIMDNAAKRHVLSLMAAELAKAATCFPIFITRRSSNNSLVFSAMTSFEMGQNLFVNNHMWEGSYLPTNLRTYPLVLMQLSGDKKQFTVGIDEESPALSKTDGTLLFDKAGKATDMLSEVTSLLEAELDNLRQSFEFGSTLESLQLLKAIDIKVQYQDSTVNVIKGLLTINEENLAKLDAQQLEQLSKIGYLKPIYALLISVYQLNALLLKNNIIDGKAKIVSVQIEDNKE